VEGGRYSGFCICCDIRHDCGKHMAPRALLVDIWRWPTPYVVGKYMASVERSQGFGFRVSGFGLIDEECLGELERGVEAVEPFQEFFGRSIRERARKREQEREREIERERARDRERERRRGCLGELECGVEAVEPFQEFSAESEREGKCVCERERACVCVCVCERERGRGCLGELERGVEAVEPFQEFFG